MLEQGGGDGVVDLSRVALLFCPCNFGNAEPTSSSPASSLLVSSPSSPAACVSPLRRILFSCAFQIPSTAFQALEVVSAAQVVGTRVVGPENSQRLPHAGHSSPSLEISWKSLTFFGS